jgi:hypothetical protein
MLLIGLAETVEFAAYETLLQQAVPESVIGRASGTMDSFFFNMMLVGNVLSGVLAGVLGLTRSIVGLGAVVLAVTAYSWWNLRRKTAGQPSPEMLAKVPAFARVPVGVREWAIRRMIREQFEQGAIVIHQGDQGDKFYTIAKGTAQVEISEGDQHLRRELGPGEFFGEIALLRNVPRTATVRAAEPLTVYAMSREDFDELQQRAGEFKNSLLETATSRLADNTDLKLALATRPNV